jgi:hypothetical protein
MLRCTFVALDSCTLGLRHDPLTITFIVVGEEPEQLSRKTKSEVFKFKAPCPAIDGMAIK